MSGPGSTTLYFAFGSNLDAEQMAERCPGSRPLFRARLPGHRLDFTHLSQRWGGGAADILPAESHEVWGVIYALEPGHLDALDRFEAGYRRVSLGVHADDAIAHAVTSYQVRMPGRHAPSRAYLEKMLRWGERWQLPGDYLGALRAIRTVD